MHEAAIGLGLIVLAPLTLFGLMEIMNDIRVRYGLRRIGDK